MRQNGSLVGRWEGFRAIFENFENIGNLFSSGFSFRLAYPSNPIKKLSISGSQTLQ